MLCQRQPIYCHLCYGLPSPSGPWSSRLHRLQIKPTCGSVDRCWLLLEYSDRKCAMRQQRAHHNPMKLEWVPTGPSSLDGPKQFTANLSITHVFHVEADSKPQLALNKLLQPFWELESLGIPLADWSVLNQFQESIHLTGKRYQVSLPWRTHNRMLPHNYDLCQRLLQGLLGHLRNNPTLLREYDSVIQNQLQQGIVEPVDQLISTDESNHETLRSIHYTCTYHIMVSSASKRTQWKSEWCTMLQQDVEATPWATACILVPSFNHAFSTSSSDSLSTSSSDWHHSPAQGHNENQSGAQCFNKMWRPLPEWPPAYPAQVSTAHFQPPPQIQNILCHLHCRHWEGLSDDSNGWRRLECFAVFVGLWSNSTITWAKLRFTRVVFGVSASPFLLNATIQHHLEHAKVDFEIMKRWSRAFYVDDIVTGAEDQNEAHTLY